MGKGQRVRAGRAAEKEAKKVAAAKAAQKQKVTRLIALVSVIVVAIGIVGGFAFTNIRSAAIKRGDPQRKTIVLESDNYKVDAAMMSYYFYSQYNNFANTYSSMLSSLGLDTSKSLKSQECAIQSGLTWYDYFADMAGESAKEYLYLAENAVKAGLKLDDKDQENIDKTIDSYEEVAKEQKMKLKDFIPAAFGTGVNEGDVRKCLELATISDKYYQKFYDELKYTDKDIDAFYKKNIDTYRYVDYYSYSVAAEDTEDKATYADAKKAAEKLAAVSSTKAFENWVAEDVESNASITKDYTEKDLEEDIDEAVDSAKYTNMTFTEGNKASEWLFEKAKVGDTYIDDDGKGTYTVYYCTATPHRDESLTRTIRNIVLTNESHEDKETCKKTAVNLLAEMKKAGLTEETFNKYALEYSENTANYTDGGLCENYKQSAFEEHMGEWAYDDERKAGDFEVVEYDDGYALCYYIGEGIAAWKSDCIADKKAEDYAAAAEKWKKDIAVTENENGYKKIPDIR